jgi:hypothetical protein
MTADDFRKMVQKANQHPRADVIVMDKSAILEMLSKRPRRPGEEWEPALDTYAKSKGFVISSFPIAEMVLIAAGEPEKPKTGYTRHDDPYTCVFNDLIDKDIFAQFDWAAHVTSSRSR